MVVGICAENADVIEVFVAVGWWWVLVCAELVASTEDAGVKETGSGFIVELCRTAVTPWGAFDVAREWRGYIGARDDGVLGGKDWLELVAKVWGRLRPVVSCSSGLVVLFEDGLGGGSSLSGEGVAGCFRWYGCVGV